MRIELEGRPLLGLAAALILGLTIPLHPANVLLALPLLWLYRNPWVRTGLGALLLIGLVLAPTPVSAIKEARSYEGAAVVVSTPKLYPDSTSFQLKVQDYHVRASMPGRPVVSRGDRLRVQGELRPPPPGLGTRYEMEQLHGRLNVRSYEVYARGPSLIRWAEGWRGSFMTFAEQTSPSSVATVLEALCFNAGSMLDAETSESLRRTGTFHIVSSSGMHVVILAVALMFALSNLPIARHWQLLAATVALAFYAMATGLNPPVVRAVLMALVGYGAYLIRREADLISALALSCVVYLLWQPASIYKVGFQLSFLIVFAFALFLRKSSGDRPEVWDAWMLRGRDVVRASFVASVSSAPVMAYHFGFVSMVGIFANLALAAVVAPVMILAMAAHVVSFLSLPVAQGAMVVVVQPLVGWMHFVLHWVSAPPWAVLNCPPYPAYWMIPVYAAGLLLWRPLVRQP
jgi:ComEC/Rec2-related protein